MENVRRHRNVNFFVTERRRNYLLSEPHYYTIKCFTENLLAIEMKKKNKILMTKLVCMGLSILELSKILISEFWYDYVKQQYGEKAYMVSLHT